MTNISNNTIAKNTLFLFFRTLLIMGISLYTSRVVLSVLGVEDYGIYNVVGGIVSLLAFLNSAMVQASQRYLSFAQGTDDLIHQRNVFTNSILIHVTIALIVVLVLETIGLWYVNTKLVLPQNRLYAANVIYQFSILIFLCRILVVPYNASVIAHEKMNVYAFISIADYLLQLVLIYFFQVVEFDKLILYGAMMLLVACLNYIYYIVYTKRKYLECTFKWNKDWALYKEMFGFASWAFLGGAGYIASNQGVNIVINLFCGPAVNAARGVAYQANAAVQTLISSFQQSMNPQIIKRFASGNQESMMLLVKAGSKYSFLLLLICFIPFIVRPEYILELWLGSTPEYAAVFLVLSIIVALITSMGGPLNTAIQATGNIKVFQIVVSVIMFADVPLSYYLLTKNVEPYLVTFVTILTSIICLFVKLLILRTQLKYDFLGFVISVVIRNAIVATLVIALFIYLSELIPMTFIGLVLICFLSVVLNGFIIYFIGLDISERVMFYKIIKTIIVKFLK